MDQPETTSLNPTAPVPAKNVVLDWPVWWSELSSLQKGLPAVLVLAYWGALNVLRGFRPDHLNIGMAILVLSYGGRHARMLLRFAMPFLLTAIIYDSQRFYSDFLRGPIRVTEPYDFDKRFFGIPTAQGVLTPNEWFQLHTHWLLDLITGFAYLVFIGGYAAIAAWFRFRLTRTGTPKASPGRVQAMWPAITWSFLWVNLLGYSTYYWYAAAPPWYVAQYGLGPARLDVAASSAGCARFDKILGTHFFSEMYGRAADVFGAIPSLHVAYPLLAVYFAFRLGALRSVAVGFYALMVFSAVYLNHHYLLDVLWGSAYALLIGVLMERIFEGRATRAEVLAKGAR